MVGAFFLGIFFLKIGSAQLLMIDQAGSYDDQFPYNDLHSWGVTHVAAGGIDCSSYLSSIDGGPWYDSSGLSMVASSIAKNKKLISDAHKYGLKIFMTSDLFQVPSMLFKKYSHNLTYHGSTCFGYVRGPSCIDIRSQFTQQVLQAIFSEMDSTFPELDGLILRYGENSPCKEHEGNAPFDTSNPIPSLSLLLNFIREELCVKRNKTVIFRTWDTSTQMFHANKTFYEAVTSAVLPHPLLIFSIKHTALDFWRRVAINPTLAVGNHSQVVEAEVGGMYAGSGSWPLYIGDPLINGYPENVPSVGLAQLFNGRKSVLKGILTNHQSSTPMPARPAFWPRLEQAVISEWSRDTQKKEEDVFAQVAAKIFGFPPAVLPELRRVAQLSSSANLKLYTVEVFDSAVNPLQMDRPTANWFACSGLGGLWQLDPSNHTSQCHAYQLEHCLVFPWLGSTNRFVEALAEKESARQSFKDINQTVFTILAPSLLPSSLNLSHSLRAAAEQGVFVSSIISTGWQIMALGWQGDHNGGHYNVSGLRNLILEYDNLWNEYNQLPIRYGLPSCGSSNASCYLASDRYWVHESTNQPGMGQSIDTYRRFL